MWRDAYAWSSEILNREVLARLVASGCWSWLAATDTGLVETDWLPDRLHDLMAIGAMTLTIVITLHNLDARIAYDVGRKVSRRRSDGS